jgi:hypothetical protein
MMQFAQIWYARVEDVVCREGVVVVVVAKLSDSEPREHGVAARPAAMPVAKRAPFRLSNYLLHLVGNSDPTADFGSCGRVGKR